jgi:mono/diheme cytochrome c family protein
VLGVAAVAGGAVGYGRLFPREDMPAEFAGLVSPVRGDAAAVQRGAELFRDNCASCHGENADGNGPGARGLDPPPANFHGSDVLERHSDAYLYYRLTKGKPGTAMPSFDGALDPSDRWALIAYLRTIGPVDDAH